LIVLTAAMLASMPPRGEETAVADPSHSPAGAVKA
jgi:hypothetical protein